MARAIIARVAQDTGLSPRASGELAGTPGSLSVTTGCRPPQLSTTSGVTVPGSFDSKPWEAAVSLAVVATPIIPARCRLVGPWPTATDRQRRVVAASISTPISACRRRGHRRETGLHGILDPGIDGGPAVVEVEEATIDLDATDVEVYGAGKQGAAMNRSRPMQLPRASNRCSSWRARGTWPPPGWRPWRPPSEATNWQTWLVLSRESRPKPVTRRPRCVTSGRREI